MGRGKGRGEGPTRHRKKGKGQIRPEKASGESLRCSSTRWRFGKPGGEARGTAREKARARPGQKKLTIRLCRGVAVATAWERQWKSNGKEWERQGKDMGKARGERFGKG